MTVTGKTVGIGNVFVSIVRFESREQNRIDLTHNIARYLTDLNTTLLALLFLLFTSFPRHKKLRKNYVTS